MSLIFLTNSVECKIFMAIEIRHYTLPRDNANRPILHAESIRKAPTRLVYRGCLEANFNGRNMPLNTARSMDGYLEYCRISDMIPFSIRTITFENGRRKDEVVIASYEELIKLGFLNATHIDFKKGLENLRDNAHEHSRMVRFGVEDFQRFARLGELDRFFQGRRPVYYPTNCKLDFGTNEDGKDKIYGRTYVGSEFRLEGLDAMAVREAGISSRSGLLLLIYNAEKVPCDDLRDWFTKATREYGTTRQIKTNIVHV